MFYFYIGGLLKGTVFFMLCIRIHELYVCLFTCNRVSRSYDMVSVEHNNYIKHYNTIDIVKATAVWVVWFYSKILYEVHNNSGANWEAQIHRHIY